MRQIGRVAPGVAALATGFVACLVIVAVARVADVPVWLSTALVAAAVAVCTPGGRIGIGVLVGGLGWLFVTGFVVHRLGELQLHDAGELWRLLLLVGVGVLAGSWRRRPEGASRGASEGRSADVSGVSRRAAESR